MFRGSPHDGLAVEHVLAFELISDRFPLSKSMENELTLFPTPLLPCVSTYKSSEGREEELPHLARNKPRAPAPAPPPTPFISCEFCPPGRFPSGAVPRQPSRRLKLVAEIICLS